MKDHDPVQSRLPLLENALLWAMRAWTIGSVSHVDVAGRIVLLFTMLKAPEAAGYLGGFMWVLSRSAKRGLDINCTCNPDVSADESRLLDVLALQQEGFHDGALTLLAGMMSRQAASAGCDSALRLVQALQHAGHRLPRGQDAVWRHCLQQPAGRRMGLVSTLLH
jgi:hypothetical protein